MVFAYLDPAAGGMLIQSIVALAVAIPFILRSQISRGIELLRGRRVTKGPEDGQTGGD